MAAAKTKQGEHRVILARDVARRWILKRAKPEYRFKVFYRSPKDVRGVVALLRGFRDGKRRIANIDPISSLGVKEGFDHVVIWSHNREAMVKLAKWFEENGFDTTGIW